MPKRRLNVTRWIGPTPAVAICTLCHREFKVPMTFLKKLAEAQANLQTQFAEHKCVEKTQ